MEIPLQMQLKKVAKGTDSVPLEPYSLGLVKNRPSVWVLLLLPQSWNQQYSVLPLKGFQQDVY